MEEFRVWGSIKGGVNRALASVNAPRKLREISVKYNKFVRIPLCVSLCLSVQRTLKVTLP